MNIFTEQNPYPPVAMGVLFSLADGGPILSPEETAEARALAVVEAGFVARKTENSRTAARDRVRAEAALYSEGKGPAPRQSLDQAAETSELIRLKVLGARKEWFLAEARPFFHALFARLLSRATAALAVVEEAHKKEADSMGLSYRRPPVVRSIERAVQLLKNDLDRFADTNFTGYDIAGHFFRRFRIAVQADAVPISGNRAAAVPGGMRATS